MSINTKKPAMKQTVGAQYMCFADATEGKEYDGTYEADVEKTEVVKSVKVTENSETSDVYASGKIYDSDSPMSSIDIEVSVIAFPDDTISKMRGETKGSVKPDIEKCEGGIQQLLRLATGSEQNPIKSNDYGGRD